MTDTIKVDTPDATQEDQVKTVEERKADLVSEREKRLLGEDEVEVETPDVEDEESEAEDETETETEEEADEVLSQVDEIDIDSLTEEDIRELAKLKGIEFDPKADKAWAVQRRKVKELEEKLEKSESAKAEALNIQKNVGAESRVAQVEANIDYWNEAIILSTETEYDEASGKDVKGVTHDGKFYPASSVLQFIKAEKAKLPELRKEATAAEKARDAVGNLDDKIDEVKEKLGLDEKASEQYDAYLSNPKFEIVKNLVPEFGVELIEMFGLAAAQGSKPAKKVVVKRKSPKESHESASPKGGSAKAAGSTGQNAKIKALEKIVSDSSQTVKARRDAQLKIRLLKTT